jgi:hypothetical protein
MAIVCENGITIGLGISGGGTPGDADLWSFQRSKLPR